MFQVRSEEPNITMNVSFFHPSIDDEYAAGRGVGASHPQLQEFFAPVLPRTHPDVMEMLEAPGTNALPVWHPNVGSTFQFTACCVAR